MPRAGDGRRRPPVPRLYHADSAPAAGASRWKDEGLNVGQPREQQFLSLHPNAIQLLTLRPDDRKGRLGDSTRVLPRQRLLLQGGQLLAEEGVGVGDLMVEGARQGLT
jgi:hypothetical protein